MAQRQRNARVAQSTQEGESESEQKTEPADKGAVFDSMVKKIREQGVLSDDDDADDPKPIRRQKRRVEDSSSALSEFVSDASPQD